MAGPKLDLNGFPISWVPAVKPEDETNMFPYKKQTRRTRKLPVGWQFAEGRRPFNQEAIFDEHVEIPLRDGVKVRSPTFILTARNRSAESIIC
jgi:hypothetical protein